MSQIVRKTLEGMTNNEMCQPYFRVHNLYTNSDVLLYSSNEQLKISLETTSICHIMKKKHTQGHSWKRCGKILPK